LSDAQRSETIPRIGYLTLTTPATTPHLRDAFQQGLRELGWIEGQNLTIEFRYAEENVDQLRAFAAELVQRKVDLIVAAGNPALRAVKPLTATIPIVMVAASDPVRYGSVTSLARSGGNITGLAEFGLELREKHLELLKEIVPGLTQVAVLSEEVSPGPALQRAAQGLGVQLQWLVVRGPEEFDNAFLAMTQQGAGALIVLHNTLFLTHRSRIAELAATHRLVAMYARREYVEAGGLLAYGENRANLWRRAATYVDKILKGARPADLPVEQPAKFELVINLKTAQALGLTILPTLLFQADKVIR
jgi:putative tryptophan/tyrosine transport system substrate-binding protein